MADQSGHRLQAKGPEGPYLRGLVLFREPSAKPGEDDVDRAALITGLEGDGHNADLEVFVPGRPSYQKRNVRHAERAEGRLAETYTWRWNF